MKPSFHDRWRRFKNRVAAEVTRLISKPETRNVKPEIDQSLLTSAATILKVARWSCWLRAFWPARSPWPRYRVTTRANPAVIRRELLRSVRGHLRRAGLNQPRIDRSTTL